MATSEDRRETDSGSISMPESVSRRSSLVAISKSYACAVKVAVRLFAGLRERAGFAEREVDGVERVRDIWPVLGLGDEPAGLLYAVNHEYADRDRALAEGDEVALIPPVSGGAFVLTPDPIDPGEVLEQ